MASDRSRRARWAMVLGVALALGAATAPLSARAQPSTSDRDAARSLMTQGDQAFDAKEYPAALKAYQAAHSIMHLPSTGIWVAKSEVALGMLVEARDMALEVKALPKQPDEKQAMVVARKEAAQLADSLAGRIPSVQVQIEGPTDPGSIQLTIDGATIPAAAIGVPRKVNPGKHTIAATAPGFARASKDIEVKEGEAAKPTLTLPPEASTPAPVPPPASGAPVPAPPATGATAPPPSATAPAVPPDAAGGTSSLVYIGFIGGGLGLGVGVVTGILSLSRVSGAKDACDDDGHCPVKVSDKIDSAKTLAWVSNIGFGVALVGGVIGVVGIMTGGHAPASSQGKVSLVPIAGPDGVGLAGRF